MRRGGYLGPEDTSGLLGCALLSPFYLFLVAWIIDGFAYAGEDALALSSFIGVTLAFYVIVCWARDSSNHEGARKDVSKDG
jgi:positive regulator of sigma E activity